MSSLHPAYGGLALAAWSFIVAFFFLEQSFITSRPLVLNGFLFDIKAEVREGLELALFITAAFFAGNNEQVGSNTIQTLAGVVLGLGTAVLHG